MDNFELMCVILFFVAVVSALTSYYKFYFAESYLLFLTSALLLLATVILKLLSRVIDLADAEIQREYLSNLIAGILGGSFVAMVVTLKDSFRGDFFVFFVSGLSLIIGLIMIIAFGLALVHVYYEASKKK